MCRQVLEGVISNMNYFALLKHPLLRPLSTQLLDILKHVEYDVLHVHCKHKRATFTLKTAKSHISSEVNKDKNQSQAMKESQERRQSWLCYSQRPSSVRSTLMMKNMKPRAPSFCPPTSVFTQPSKHSRASSATDVRFRQGALRWNGQTAWPPFCLTFGFELR